MSFAVLFQNLNTNWNIGILIDKYLCNTQHYNRLIVAREYSCQVGKLFHSKYYHLYHRMSVIKQRLLFWIKKISQLRNTARVWIIDTQARNSAYPYYQNLYFWYLDDCFPCFLFIKENFLFYIPDILNYFFHLSKCCWLYL